MENLANGVTRERMDFSRIKTSIPIPNLIEVQKKSYERFLQMDLLPGEREDTGLQSVFNSVFPISDFRGLSQLEFVDYAIGNWECKCGNLKGLHHLRSTCRNPSCGATIKTDPFHVGDVLCHRCGTFNKNIVTFCNRCGDPVGLQLKYDVAECEERGMTYAAPLKVTIRLTVYDKDAETGAKTVRDIKEQEVFFGEIPLMTENGQRHRARDRIAVAPFARSVLRARSGARLFSGQDHSLPGKLGRIRIRQQEFALRPYRPQTQILWHCFSARPGPEDRRRNPEGLL
jgi:DNA-directed RNA polymerase subunit beta